MNWDDMKTSTLCFIHKQFTGLIFLLIAPILIPWLVVVPWICLSLQINYQEAIKQKQEEQFKLLCTCKRASQQNSNLKGSTSGDWFGIRNQIRYKIDLQGAYRVRKIKMSLKTYGQETTVFKTWGCPHWALKISATYEAPTFLLVFVSPC